MSKDKCGNYHFDVKKKIRKSYLDNLWNKQYLLSDLMVVLLNFFAFKDWIIYSFVFKQQLNDN